MSDGNDRNAAESAQGSTSSGLATATGNPRLNLDRVHRGLASLIRQGVIVPNNGDYAPPDIQDEDGGEGEPVD